MDGPGGSGKVVSIAGRAGRPDYKRLASAQVHAAMEILGEDREGFAAYLSDLLGWTVQPGTVERWERGATPPGDAVKACETIAQGLPAGMLIPAQPASLLESYPGSFPAQAIAGPWVTCYRFQHGDGYRHHADIAHITPVSERLVHAINHPPSPRTEGRSRPFRNEIEAQVANRHLVGHWRNTSDTRYFGSLELAVLPGETVMEGHYMGFASDILVSMGRWRWVRLDAQSFGAVPPQTRLRDPVDLHELVMDYSQYDVPLTLADIGEDAS